MSQYRAPLTEMLFVMNDVAGLADVSSLPGFEDASPDTVAAILEEAGKFASGVLDPLNVVGDREGARLRDDGGVATPPGFKDAYRQFCELGWNGLAKDPEYGGQGMPQLVAAAIDEMWNSANMAFELCPMLTGGAIEAIEMNGSDELKQRYLPKMVSGEWTGTMNLTEPQAGSDLAAVRTKAVPQPDGSYKIYGNKIFITYGDHDYTDNIVHLVLARTPDAPPGVKGISLFVVPKFVVGADGRPGAANDVRCVSLEHKLGIHASPTAVLAFGDGGGAVGHLVGRENNGLEYMFVMMNQARFGVGMQGVGVGERAYQRAAAYARERVQGRVAGEKGTSGIIGHPDVRRMLMSMRACTEASRALGYVTAAALDHAHRHPDEAVRAKKRAFAELMIPIVKGWSTETAQRTASLGVQVHGGMGYIEETGAAQYYRDARIAPIYEGTNGIQALDLANRKLRGDSGAAMQALEGEIAQFLAAETDATFVGPLRRGLDVLAEARARMLAHDPVSANAVATPFLRLAASVVSGWLLAVQAREAAARLANGSGDPAMLKARIAVARFYLSDILPQSLALASVVAAGKGELMSEAVLPLG